MIQLYKISQDQMDLARYAVLHTCIEAQEQLGSIAKANKIEEAIDALGDQEIIDLIEEWGHDSIEDFIDAWGLDDRRNLTDLLCVS